MGKTLLSFLNFYTIDGLASLPLSPSNHDRDQSLFDSNTTR